MFPDAQAYMLAWSSAQPSQQAAADALFGGIAISGRSPTGMDPFFAVGDGIQYFCDLFHAVRAQSSFYGVEIVKCALNTSSNGW